MKSSATLLVFFLLFISTIAYAQTCDDGVIAACACEGAPVLCSIDELDGFMIQLSSDSRPEDGPTPICPGLFNTETNNPTWFAFTAWCNSLTLRATFANCTGNRPGAQLVVYTDCTFNNVVVCNSDVSFCDIPTQDLNMNGLEIGRVYYIMLDGCAGAVCDATFEVIGDCGIEEIAPWPDNTIAGTDVVCAGENHNYTVARPDGARQFFWFIDGNLHEEVESNTLNIEWLDPGSYELCVDVANDPCVPMDTPPFEICKTIQVVGPRAGDVNLEGAESICTGESVNISVFDNNQEPGLEQSILVVDDEGIVIEVFTGSQASWTPFLNGDYSIYSVNYSPFYFFEPGPGTHIDDIGCVETCCDLSMIELFVGNPIIALQSQTNIDCNNATGSVTMTASSGLPTYEYSIDGSPFQNNPTFSGLTAGSHDITVRDGSFCTDMMQVTILEDLPVLIDNVTFSPSTCGNSNGRITVSSSLSGITYSLNGGPFQSQNIFNNVAAGQYTVTARNSANCETTRTVTVTDIAGPNLALGNQVNIDCNTPTGSLTANATVGTPPYQYSIDGTNFQTSNTFTGLAQGGYTITVRDNNTCTNTVTANITTNIYDVIDNVTSSPAACNQATGSVTVSSSAPSPLYAINGGNTQTGNTFNNLTPGSYTVNVIDANGCTDTRTITVGNTPGPTAALVSQINLDCNTPAGTATVSANAGTAPYEYSIDGTNFQTSSTFTGLAVGNYTVRVRDANACTDDVAVEITANIYDLIDNIIPTPATCNQADGILTVNSSAPGARFAIGNGQFQASNTFTGLLAGTYTIRVLDDNNCQTSQEATVSNLNGPGITLESQVNIDCNNPVGIITVNVSSGTAPYQYSIDGTNFQDENVFEDLTAATYTVSVRDGNACLDDVVVEITENLYPLIDDVTSTPTACSQSTGTITVASSANGVSYSLDGGPAQASNVFTDLAAGSYTITVVDENSCMASQSISVENPGGPSIALNNQINIDCNTPTGSITVSATSGATPYTYSIDGVNYQADPTFTGLATGTYSVRVRDVNDCIDATSVEVTANLYDVIDSIDSSVAACGQPTGSLTVNSSASGVTYSIDGGPAQTQNTFTGLVPGTYTITAIDENNCEAIQIATVDDSAGPTIALDSQINIDCNTPAGSVTLSATAGNGPYQYSIDGGAFQDENTFTGLAIGNHDISVRDINNCTDDMVIEVTANIYALIDDIQTVPSACGQAIGSIIVSSSANGMTYSLDGGPFQTESVFTDVLAGTHTIDVIDENSCTASQEVTVDDLPGPTAAVDSQINIDCNIPTGSVTLSASSGTGPYEYSIDGINFQAGTTFTGLETGSYTMTIRDANACTDQITAEVTSNIYPLIDDIETTPSACQQAIGSITVNSSASGVTYSLDGGPYQSDPTFTDVLPGAHTIAVIDENSCETSQEVMVDDLPGPSIALESQINIDCNTPGGTASVSVSSGTGPYEYSIDGINFQSETTFTDIPAGNYTMIVRDANACTDQVNLEITANIYDIIDNVAAAPSACGQSIGSITVSSSAPGATYSLDGQTFQEDNVFADLVAGEYTITVIDQNNCQDFRTITVDDLAGPSIALNNQVNIDCNTPAGSISVSATSGTGAYTYSIDGVNFQNSSDFIDLPTGNYTISVRDENACVDEIDVEITANIYPLIDSIAIAPSACGQAIGTIAVSSSANGVTYSLDGGPFQPEPIFNDVLAGPHRISVIDENSCETFQDITVDDLPGPSLALNNQINIDCNTPSGTASVSVSSGTGPYEYSIDGINFQNEDIFTELVADNYTITVRDANACTDQVSLEITADLYDIIDDVTFTPSACGQASGSITVNSSAPGATYSIDGQTFGSDNLFPSLTAGSYTLTVIDQNNCQDFRTVIVNDLDGPSIALDNQVNIDCNTPAGSISVSATSGTGAYTYSIDGVNFESGSDFTDLPTGNYTISVQDENACIDAVDVEITANLYPLIDSIGIQPSACNQSIGSISITSSASGMQYSLNGNSFQTSTNFENLPAGSYTLDVIDENNCEETRTLTVSDLDGPSISLDDQVDIDCTTPTGSITVSASSGTAPYMYSLDATNFQMEGTFTELPAGSYTLSVRDANACLNLVSTLIEDNIPLLIEDVQSASTTCGDDDGTVSIISSLPDLNYSLDDGESFQASSDFVNLPAGDYNVRVTNNTGCVETAIITVADSDPVAVPTIDVTPTSCGANNGVVVLTENTTQTIQYAIGNLPFQRVNSFTNLASGDYTLAMINEEDCEASAAINIAASTPLEIEFVEATRSSCGTDDGTIDVATNRGNDLLSYFLNGQAVTSPLVGLAPNPYFLTVVDANNCVDSVRVNVITGKCNIYVPNAFSPNDDEANDVFRVYIPENLEVTIQSFAVYDRWGNPVYEFYPGGEAFDLEDMAWDGKINGQLANLGVYVYALVYTDENNYKQVLSGDVLLMR